MSEWLAPDADRIPALLKDQARWMAWKASPEGQKVPYAATNLHRAIDPNQRANWSTFAAVVSTSQQAVDGYGFALGSAGDVHFAGVDFDKCRNKKTGEIDVWARKLIKYFDSYTEISPSGTGVKIFVLGTLPEGAKQGKRYKIEIYDHDRYFAVTGRHLDGTPTTIEPREAHLRELHKRVWTGELLDLVNSFDLILRQDESKGHVYIRCPWIDGHSTPDGERDATLLLTDGKPTAFKCLHASCSQRNLSDVLALFGLEDEIAKKKQRLKEDLRLRREVARELDADERGPIPEPEILTLHDFLAEPDEDTAWSIVHCQPRGSRVVLSAQFKTGKTTVVANLIRSLRDGDPFLGKYAVPAINGTIALLDFEMGRKQLKRWYRDQRIADDGRVIVIPLRGAASSFDITDDEVRAAWVRRLREKRVGYIIIDCLRPILDALGLDENRDTGKFLGPFDTLLAEAGITDALVIHHMGHQNERARGDSRLRDWPDVEWRLMRKDDDLASSRYFTAYGRDVDIGEQRLEYDPVTRRLTIVGGSRREGKIEEALPVVLAFIGAAPTPPTRNAILKGLADSGFAKNILDAAIKMGVSRGHIVTKDGPQRKQLHSIVATASMKQESMLDYDEIPI